MKAVEALVIWALVNALLAQAQSGVASGQAVLAVDGKPTLTVTKIERLTEFERENRKVSARAGYEFVRAHFVAKWFVKAEQDPCDFLAGMRDPRSGVRPGEYELVDNNGGKVLGTTMDSVWVALPAGAPPPESCAFTILFQESPAGSHLAKIRLKGAEADISKLSGVR